MTVMSEGKGSGANVRTLHGGRWGGGAAGHETGDSLLFRLKFNYT